MIEAIVEGGGVIAGLALLMYFQVIRPGQAERHPRDVSSSESLRREPPSDPPA